MVEKLLNANQVGEILGISRSKAFSLLQQGEIPVVRIKRNVRVREVDLQQYIVDHLSGIGVSDQKSHTRPATDESGNLRK
jgi:excisionase family DNA binding protein